MGYRSNIVIIMHNDFCKDFEECIDASEYHYCDDISNNENWWDEKDDHAIFKDYTVYSLIHWKWDRTAPWVKQIEHYINSMLLTLDIIEEPDRTICAVRLGEDYGDYEVLFGQPKKFNIYPTHELSGV